MIFCVLSVEVVDFTHTKPNQVSPKTQKHPTEATTTTVGSIEHLVPSCGRSKDCCFLEGRILKIVERKRERDKNGPERLLRKRGKRDIKRERRSTNI